MEEGEKDGKRRQKKVQLQLMCEFTLSKAVLVIQYKTFNLL